MLSHIILAISVSIDSLGIGLTYGIKNTQISALSKIVLFIISITITFLSMFVGNIISAIIPNNFANCIGLVILLFMGVWIIFQNSDPLSFDTDCSKKIDLRESIALGIALSLDSFGIGICSSIVGYNIYLFPIFVACFQLIFLSFGIFLGKKMHSNICIQKNIWPLISGFLLIIIGLSKIFI